MASGACRPSMTLSFDAVLFTNRCLGHRSHRGDRWAGATGMLMPRSVSRRITSGSELCTPAFAVGDVGEGFAGFFTLADGGSGVAEGEDGEHVQVVGDAEEGFDRVEIAGEADPVAADAVVPGGKHHVLDGSAAIGYSEGGAIDGDDDG